ncbi:Spermidine synthase [hydrothermal vent metagenome]|uniref:Spermidine synthase n=1 Tax=hydrothermal vent metagenome TaxID=652676 RepID=A0A3B1DEU6_9ZZZZ
MNQSKKNSWVLYLSIFVMGGCGLAYEYTFSKLSTDLLGNSSRQWALIIGIMMFFMGIGADLQKRVKKDLIGKFITAEIILGLVGSFGPIVFLYSFGAFRDYFVLIQYIFICFMGVLIGFEIPLLTRINEKYSSQLSVNLGNILKMDYFGSVIGALVWIFVLPKFFTIIEGAFVLGMATLLTAAVSIYFFRDLIKGLKRFVFCASISFLLICFGYTQSAHWTVYAEQRLYRDRIIFSQTTDYQHIVLTQSTSGEIACYINGHLQFNSIDEHIYHENLVHPVMNIAPRRDHVLVLGGGDGMAVREVLKYKDVKKITLVDLDPVMTFLARENPFFVKMNDNSLNNAKVKIIKNNTLVLGAKEDLYIQNQNKLLEDRIGKVAELNVINLDAVRFMELVQGKYDVIIIDFPDPNSLELAKLYSQQFYQLVTKKLTPRGLLVQQSTSPIHAKEAFLCVGRTMKQSGLVAVPIHDNVPSFGEWGWWIAGREQVYTEKKLRQKLKNVVSLMASTQYLSVDLMQASVFFGKAQFETQETDINTISSTRIYDYYLQAWRE